MAEDVWSVTLSAATGDGGNLCVRYRGFGCRLQIWIKRAQGEQDAISPAETNLGRVLAAATHAGVHHVVFLDELRLPLIDKMFPATQRVAMSSASVL